MTLPFVDEHSVLVTAPALAVWEALMTRIPRFASSGRFARLLGASPPHASGGPLIAGSTLPGFAVTQAVPGALLELTGHHRFSRYKLTLTLTTQPDGTMLTARTDAAFPGLHGSVYRLLVIGSGMHRLLVVRLLRDIRRPFTR